MKMRTKSKGFEEYKKTVDPNTCITLHSWKQIVSSGEIKSARKCGNRLIYDLEEVIEYLKNPSKEDTKLDSESDATTSYGKLRKIES